MSQGFFYSRIFVRKGPGPKGFPKRIMTAKTSRILVLLLTLLCLAQAGAQQLSANLVGKDSLQADVFVGVDDLENLYYLRGNVLYKKGRGREFSFSKVGLGRLTDVNIQNPMKLILFYRDFNAVILLDNNLNELTDPIDFTRETLFNNVTFVSVASQNNIWLYADDNKLHLYDHRTLSETVQTQPMTFYEPEFRAGSVKSTFKNVWILADTGVLQFNEFGTYLGEFREAGITAIYPYQKGLIYRKGQDYWYRADGESVPLELQGGQVLGQVSVSASSVWIYDGTWVYQYRIQG